MKKCIILLIFQIIIAGNILICQNNKIDVCEDCEIKCMCREFYSKELVAVPNKLNVITSNWHDFFGEDLEKSFPNNSNVNVASIKFDGMGCIYPNSISEVDYEQIKEVFLGNEKKFKNFSSRTFYNLFNDVYARKGSITEIQFCNSFASKIDTSKLKRINNSEYEFLSFIEQWNSKYLPEKINELDTIIKNRGIKKIIFFIHGYNVPYSLAHKQGNVLIDSILHIDPTIRPNQILFVRVFWPSGNFKHKVFKVGECDYNNIENFPTALQFTYISNRAYLAGISLRKILYEIKTDLPINIITHSHGSTVATTALINTTTKLQKKRRTKNIYFDFENYMAHKDFPNKNINVFLNAPSIPGQCTFIDIDFQNQNRYKFFVGYNDHDEVLLKEKFHIWKLYFKFIKVPKHLSSTSLGCNYKNEVYKTQKIFTCKGLQDNFWSGVNSFQKQHDFFCYIKQLEFRRNLKLFLENKLFVSGAIKTNAD